MAWRLRLPLEILRWLTVLAVVAWAAPQIVFHWPTDSAPQPPQVTRAIQITPCPPWADTIGHWEGAYVCAWSAQQRWVYAKTQRGHQIL